MLNTNVSVRVRSIRPAVFIFDLVGEVNAYAENVLMERYSEINNQGARYLLLNFSEMSYMNSSGIGLLVTLLIRCKRNQQVLIAYNLDEHYRQIFELTRLNEAVGIFTTEAEALTSLNGSV